MWIRKKHHNRWSGKGERMGLVQRFLGLETTNEVPSFVPEVRESILPPARSDMVVNESTALSLVPVSRALAVLETAMMQIPVDVYRGNEKIETPLWLETPDIENNVSQAEWIGSTLVHMALTGNAFWKVTRGARGIANIQVIHPTNISVNTDRNGTVYYQMANKRYTNRDIVHIKLWAKPGVDQLLGEGPLQRHKALLRSALDLNNYADNWFRTSAVPTGTLSTTEFLSEDVAKQNKQAFIASQQERSVAVLSSGLTYESISLSPEQAQFLENQKFMMRKIATMFGVPTVYLGMSVEGQGMTYTNGNEDRNKLFEDGLQQYIVRIQQAITDLLPRGQKAKFNLTEFLRPNQLIRYQAYGIGLDKKFLTVDEIRDLEGLPPIKVEDVPVTPEPVQDVPQDNPDNAQDTQPTV
jgi:HK97 family phage portal protein